MATESGSSSEKSLEMRLAAIEDKLSRLTASQGGMGTAVTGSAAPMIPQVCTTCHVCISVIYIPIHIAQQAASGQSTQGGSQGFGNLGQ
jgi:hypothetical protein